MQSLPKLTTPGGDYVLPLADHTAELLATTLLLEGRENPSRQQLLIDALAGDPALTLWALCRATGFSPLEPVSISALAAWLGENQLELLRDLAEQGESPAGIGPDDNHVAASKNQPARPDLDPRRTACAELAAVSLAVADLAKRIADRKTLDADRAYLLGLLHAAPRWLANGLCSGSPPQYSAALPAWLERALCVIHSKPASPPISAIDCVALAIELIEGAADSGFAAEFFDREGHQAQVSAIRKAWLQAPRAGLLAPLITRLQRLRTLEDQFAGALEREKLESLKELAYGAGHEINNPLANISARAQTLLQGEGDPDRRRMLAAIHTQAMRAHEMIADMMLFARPPQPVLASIDLVDVVRAVCEEMQPIATEQHSQLLAHLPKIPVLTRADRVQIGIVLRALCTNALEALINGGKVELILTVTPDPNSAAQITVSDNGPGITPEARTHLFDPFYSGREAGRGLGFGLSKAWRIVDLHGGRIEVESGPGQGASFLVFLPLEKNR